MRFVLLLACPAALLSAAGPAPAATVLPGAGAAPSDAPRPLARLGEPARRGTALAVLLGSSLLGLGVAGVFKYRAERRRLGPLRDRVAPARGDGLAWLVGVDFRGTAVTPVGTGADAVPAPAAEAEVAAEEAAAVEVVSTPAAGPVEAEVELAAVPAVEAAEPEAEVVPTAAAEEAVEVEVTPVPTAEATPDAPEQPVEVEAVAAPAAVEPEPVPDAADTPVAAGASVEVGPGVFQTVVFFAPVAAAPAPWADPPAAALGVFVVPAPEADLGFPAADAPAPAEVVSLPDLPTPTDRIALLA